MGQSCPQTRESRDEQRKKSVAFIKGDQKIFLAGLSKLNFWFRKGDHPKFRPLVDENEKVIDDNDISDAAEETKISTKNVLSDGLDESNPVQKIDPAEIKKQKIETQDESDRDDSEESEYETDSQVKVQ